MAARRMAIIGLLLCFCLCIMPRYVYAASSADAKEPIAVDSECTLTVFYGYDGTVFPNQTVKLYKIADVSADCWYTLTSAFASSGLILNGVQTNGEWNVIRSTLEAHILAYSIEPDATSVTDQNGQAVFENLSAGLYLAIPEQVDGENLRCLFDSALIALPGLGADSYWQYQVEASAKAELLPPVEPDEELHLKVLKLWKGDERRSDRPQSIEVEIFRDGISYETVILSEDNYWSYTWSVKDDGADWMVVERNIPAEYTMTLEERGTSFILTNTRLPDGAEDPDAPQTGDTANGFLYILLLTVSGSVLIILGSTGKRRSR